MQARSLGSTSQPRSEFSVPTVDAQTIRQTAPGYEDIGDALHSEVRAGERRSLNAVLRALVSRKLTIL